MRQGARLKTGAERTSGMWVASDTHVIFQTLDGRLPDSQEDPGLSLPSNCSQVANVVGDHFARTTSVLRDSTVLSVVNAVCDSGPVLGEFGLKSELCSWTLALECVCAVLELESISTCVLILA